MTLGRVVMVVPTYNEAENIAWIVSRVRRALPEVDVLVVDDGSPDGTGRIADELAAQDPQVSVVHRSAKEGLGAAYLHGFRVALEAVLDLAAADVEQVEGFLPTPEPVEGVGDAVQSVVEAQSCTRLRSQRSTDQPVLELRVGEEVGLRLGVAFLNRPPQRRQWCALKPGILVGLTFPSATEI